MKDPLYEILEDRPDIFMANHSPSSGAFYLQLGCSNCSSKTVYFQPQHEAVLLETVPPNVEGNFLKPFVRTAYREFISQVVGWHSVQGVMGLNASRCRWRYISDPAWTETDAQPQQALTNLAAADADVSV